MTLNRAPERADAASHPASGAEPSWLPVPVPEGYHVRRPAVEDIDAIAGMAAASDLHDVGVVDFTREELEHSWRSGETDRAKDAWLVETADGSVAAYLYLHLRAGNPPDALSWVHPEHRQRGLGRLLVRLSEGRAAELHAGGDPRSSDRIAHWIHGAAEDARELLRGEGYRYTRSFFRMAIDLDAPPPEPDWPAGIALRPFSPDEDERAVYDAMTEAFRDHFGARQDFETWRRSSIERADFDPSLWHLAVAHDRIIGGSLCDVYGEQSWVDRLFVLREWRRRGLGMALLLHSFGEFHSRGRRRVDLTVDAESPTGATRLYERAGMRVERRYDRYEKELVSR